MTEVKDVKEKETRVSVEGDAIKQCKCDEHYYSRTYHELLSYF